VLVFRLLHRTIFYELAKVFLLAFVGLTGVLLLAGVITEATRNGLGPTQILAAIPLLIPSTMPYTLPTTTLFAVCIVYGRLAHDNEILALRAAGVHIRHALWPAFFLGTAVSVATFVLYLHTIPYTHYILRSEVTNDVRELLYGMLKREKCIRHPRFNYEIHVKGVQGQKLLGAQFRHRDPKGGYDMIAYAREAELLVDMANKRIHVLMKFCNTVDSKGNQEAYFDQKVWTVEMPEDLGGSGKGRPSDMTWPELFDYREQMVDKRGEVDVDIAMHQAAVNLNQGDAHFPQHIRRKGEERRNYNNIITGIDVEVHQRPAFALGCLCFVLVGCPVGVWFSKSDFLSAFITCFLPIVIVYYPLMLCAINMAKSSKLFPPSGIWAADALMLFAAAIMYRRLVRN
jgi:lipopolysaccharide export system permease protein